MIESGTYLEKFNEGAQSIINLAIKSAAENNINRLSSSHLIIALHTSGATWFNAAVHRGGSTEHQILDEARRSIELLEPFTGKGMFIEPSAREFFKLASEFTKDREPITALNLLDALERHLKNQSKPEAFYVTWLKFVRNKISAGKGEVKS